MPRVVWHLQYVGSDEVVRCNSRQPNWVMAVTNAVFTGDALPANAVNIQASLFVTKVVAGKIDGHYVDGQYYGGYANAINKTYPLTTMPTAGSSSMTIEFKHQGRPNQPNGQGGIVQGSTWEFWWPSVEITYDGASLAWPDGATCFVYPATTQADDVVSLTTAYLHWTEVADKSGWANYEIQYSDDYKVHWRTLESTATGWTEKNGELIPTGLIQVSSPPYIVSVPAYGARRWFRVRALASLGDQFDTGCLYSTNALQMGKTDPDPCTDFFFRENPCENVTLMSFLSHPGINNPIVKYSIKYRDATSASGETWVGEEALAVECMEADLAQDSYNIDPNCGLRRYVMVRAPLRDLYRQFWVKAYGSQGGETDWAPAGTRLKRLFTAPSKPGQPVFHYNPAIGQQPMSWTPSADGAGNTVVKYRVQYAEASATRRPSSSRTWQDLMETTDPIAWVDAPPVNKIWYFRVQAVGSGGLDSAWSVSSRFLLNSQTLFNANANLLWQTCLIRDLAFARCADDQVSLIAQEGDRYAHAIRIHLKHKGQEIDTSSQWYDCVFLSRKSGKLFRAQGFARGSYALVPMPLELMEQAGAVEGVVSQIEGANRTPLAHVSFLVNRN